MDDQKEEVTTYSIKCLICYCTIESTDREAAMLAYEEHVRQCKEEVKLVMPCDHCGEEAEKLHECNHCLRLVCRHCVTIKGKKIACNDCYFQVFGSDIPALGETLYVITSKHYS